MRSMPLITALLLFGFVNNAVTASQDTKLPKGYLLSKFTSHDLVLVGTTHHHPSIHSMLSDIIPSLPSVGVTHVCLEIETGQVGDHLRISPIIDCPSYRRMIKLVQDTTGLQAVPVDLPAVKYGEGISRNEYIAQQIAAIFRENKDAKVLVILGNQHVLKTLPWQDHIPNPYQSVAAYFPRLEPSKKLFSAVTCVDPPDRCDFSRRLSGPLALDVTEQYSDWKLGTTEIMAIKPTPVTALTDGVIIP